MIRDVGSSNGTFVNSKRLSEEGQSSEWSELKSGDILEFGIDINGENGARKFPFKLEDFGRGKKGLFQWSIS